MVKQCLACGKKTGIKEKDNFCPACGAKLPECVKPATYVSERIVNIKELENYIENAHLSVVSLVDEIEKGALTCLEIANHLKRIDLELKKAYEFEFCLERRTTISKAC